MGKEYEIAKTSGACCQCRRELTGGEEFVAALADEGESFRRDDFCPPCWQQRSGEQPGYFSFWHGRIPPPEQPKKPVLNTELLLDFLGKLAGQDEPAKINFRFVLALMLMRKKLLVYDGRGDDDQGRELWRMHLRGPSGGPPGESLEIVRPELDEDKIAAVAENLGQIFEVAAS